jgi:hypothetical protein
MCGRLARGFNSWPGMQPRLIMAGMNSNKVVQCEKKPFVLLVFHFCPLRKLQIEKSGINPDCYLLFQKYNICSCNNDHLQLVIIIQWHPVNDRFFKRE